MKVTRAISDRPSQQRERFIRAAAELFRVRGYNATGIADIVSLAGGPKGSLYHFFPGGKEEIARAVISYATHVASQSLSAIDAPTAANRLIEYGTLLAGWMEASGCREGCPIATTVLELAPDSGEIASLGAAAFNDWAAIFARDLENDGIDPRSARSLGRLAIASMEGALLMTRAEGNADVIREISRQIAALFTSAAQTAARKEAP